MSVYIHIHVHTHVYLYIQRGGYHIAYYKSTKGDLRSQENCRDSSMLHSMLHGFIVPAWAWVKTNGTPAQSWNVWMFMPPKIGISQGLNPFQPLENADQDTMLIPRWSMVSSGAGSYPSANDCRNPIWKTDIPSGNLI